MPRKRKGRTKQSKGLKRRSKPKQSKEEKNVSTSHMQEGVTHMDVDEENVDISASPSSFATCNENDQNESPPFDMDQGNKTQKK